MKGPPLLDLPVKQLEYVFSPAGLPLPFKGEKDIGTTSILVRGGPGSGKTTLALALAHAMAKVGGGLVLYLTTEFSPVEIAFKATLVGLAEEVVDVWPGTAGASPGGVVVQHLSEVRHGQPVLSSAERRRSSLDAVWGLLHPEKEGETTTPLPVRAVVIDALTLPETGETEGTQRADLVAFVQALESEGRSVVLVEELGQGVAAWSAFVMDVVFELSFVPDPETQELRRKLTLSKCRYAVSIPGPHDYGLEGGSPAVWPNLFRVVTGNRGHSQSRLQRVSVPSIFVPMKDEDVWVALGASIILSPYDVTGSNAPSALGRTPGVAMTRVDCGARTTIDGSPPYSVFDYEGVHSMGWAILTSGRPLSRNGCLFQGLDALYSRPGWMTPVVHMLEALRSVGYVLCLHATERELDPLRSLSDLVWDGSKCTSMMVLRRRRRVLGLKRLKFLPQFAGKLEQKAAWLRFYTGDDWHAARVALTAMETDDPAPTMILLWKAVCAAVANNRVAIDELKTLLGSADEILILDPLLRGLAGTGELDEADRIIAEVGARGGLDPWMLESMRAEARLVSYDDAVLRDAADRFEKLSANDVLSQGDRADALFNLGVARDHLYEHQAAVAAFEQALTQNSKLQAAQEELVRLKASL